MRSRADLSASQIEVDDTLQLIRAEYEEFPGLRLSRSEIEELFELDHTTADWVLRASVSGGLLRETSDGDYVSARVPTETPST